MIASLRGRLAERFVDRVVVECGGVGYRVTMPVGTMAALPTVGREVHLHTHHHIREDHQALYGFPTTAERDCFEALIGAHGVGPALALAILSVHRPAELARVLADGDIGALCLVPGVGRKTAARLLVELRSRLDLDSLDGAGGAGLDAIMGAGGAGAAPGDGAAVPRIVIRQALAELGYGAEEVRHALDGHEPDLDEAALLRASLQKLAAIR